MKLNIVVLAAAAVLMMGTATSPAVAGGLLKKVTGAVGDTVSGVTDTVSDTVSSVTGGSDGGSGGGGGGSIGGLVSINDDDNDSLVNVDLLNGGDDEILNASVGRGGNPLVNANVSSSGLLSNTVVSLNLGGLGVNLTIGVGSPGPNGPNPGPNEDGVILVGSLGGGDTFVVTCAVNNTRQLLQIAAQGKITANEIRAWQRSANVQVIPIKLCPAAKKQIAKILSKSQKINLLRRAVTTDALIMASLGRTRYDAGDVVAVQRRSGQLVVYVY